MIEQIVFIGPRQRVADCEVALHLPLISRKQAITIVVRSQRLIVGLRLSAITSADQDLKDREFLEVSNRRQQTGNERPRPRRVQLQAVRQSGGSPKRGEMYGIPQHDNRRLDVFPTATPIEMLPFAADADAVSALLPAQRVGHLIGAQFAVLRRIQIVTNHETTEGCPVLCPTQADAGHRVCTFIGGGNFQTTTIVPVRVAEVIDELRRKDRGDAAQPLSRDVFCDDPVRRQERPVGGVVVVTVVAAETEEATVLLVVLIIEFDVGLSGVERS